VRYRRARRCTRSPCGPKIARACAGPATAPARCGIQVEDSAASPGTSTRCVGLRPRTALAAALGCALDEGGFVIAAEQDRQTTVDRVYAAGNCADPMQNVPLATADGARAAVAVNVRLVEEGVVQPRADGLVAPRR
jgi:hypothetical protein